MPLKSFDLTCSKREMNKINWLVMMDRERQAVMGCEHPDPARVRELARQYARRRMRRTARQLMIDAGLDPEEIE